MELAKLKTFLISKCIESPLDISNEMEDKQDISEVIAKLDMTTPEKDEGDILSDDIDSVLQEKIEIIQEIQENIENLFEVITSESRANRIIELKQIYTKFIETFESVQDYLDRLKKNWINYEIEFIKTVWFYKQIYNSNINLLESYFSLIEAKLLLLDKFYKDKKECDDIILNNRKKIEQESENLESLKDLLDKDPTAFEYLSGLIEIKENLIKGFEQYNNSEPELIDSNINSLLNEIEFIKKQIKTVHYSF